MNRQERRAAMRQNFQQLVAEAAAALPPRPVFPPTGPDADAPALDRAAINRANAQHSTGPKTEQGKANSSRNSFQHGLYSKQLVVPGEDPAILDALKADLFTEHQPATETESFLVNEMAEHMWRIRRARAFEAKILSDPNCPIAHLNAALRLMSSAERGFHKALKTLRELQKERGFVPQPSSKEPAKGTEAPRAATATAGSVPHLPTDSPAEPRQPDATLTPIPDNGPARQHWQI